MTNRRPFDATLRSLATRHSEDFLRWFVGEGAVFEQTLDSVLVASERRADFLVSFRDEHDQTQLLHAEFQRQIDETDPAANLPFRMTEYAAAIRRRYGRVPLQVLVLIEDSAAARRVPDFFSEAGLQANFRVLRLWEQDPRLILEAGPAALVPLVPLMAGRPDDLLERSLTALDTQVQSEQERKELLSGAALLASIRVNAEVIFALLRSRAMLNLLEDTPLGQLLLAEREARGRAEGQAEGEARGRAEGQAEGRAEGIRQVLLHQLNRRFGPLPEHLTQQLLDIRDPERLNALADAAFDAQDIEAFRLQLGSLAQPPREPEA